MKSRRFWFPTEYPETIPVNCSDKVSMCVVYLIWGDEKYYVQCLYWSLVSQIKYTDIESADVKIFVSSSQYEFAKKNLAPFQIDIIKMDDGFSEVTIYTHAELSGYKHIVKIDADIFFTGRKANLYQSICELNIQSVGMFPEIFALTRPMIQFHKKCLTGSNATMSNYLRGYAQSMNIPDKEIARRIDNAQWHYGCFYVCNLDFFRSKSWSGMMEYCQKINSTTIETIMILYAHEHIVDLDVLLSKDIKFSVGETSIELFREDCDWLKIVHPARNGEADYRVVNKIIEGILAKPEAVSLNHAVYSRPIRLSNIEGVEGGRFFKLEPTSKFRILCVGCSFTNLRFGWPYFLSKILSTNYEIVNIGMPGAGLEMFLDIFELLKSYEPNFVILNSMCPSRILTKSMQQECQFIIEEWNKDNMSIEEKSSILMTAWLSFRQFSKQHIRLSQKLLDKQKSSMKKFKAMFSCPVIYMANKYDYPYYNQFSSVRDQFDLVTSFRGIEYSTYSRFRRDEVWHPSVKRAKEEAEQLAKLLLSRTEEPHSQTQE